MRAVCQRVSEAGVAVGETVVGEIGRGLVVLLGVERGDGEPDAERLAVKVSRLRIFEGESGKFDLALLEIGGAALVISQFTLIADTRKGNRPSFARAAPPEEAKALYERFCEVLTLQGIPVERGVFGERMAVRLVNEGPVTIVLD